MKTHNMQITPTDLRGVDSGRVRYRVVCTACGVLVHEATTGPVSAVRDHFEGRPGYERPLLDLERERFWQEQLAERERFWLGKCQHPNVGGGGA